MIVVSATLDRVRPEPFDEDIHLVERHLAGDAGAFEELYRRHYEKVLGLARGVLLDQDEAADAVQEVFTLVYRNLHRFDRRSRFSTWLFRISVNRAIQVARRNRHKSRWLPLQEAAHREAPVEVQPDGDPKVTAALRQLAPQDRAILTFFYWEDLSLQEIAESLGCNVNAAKTRLYRARERFRSLYEEIPE